MGFTKLGLTAKIFKASRMLATALRPQFNFRQFLLPLHGKGHYRLFADRYGKDRGLCPSDPAPLIYSTVIRHTTGAPRTCVDTDT